MMKHVKFLFPLFLFLGAFSHVSISQTLTWNGNISSAWNEPLNWTPNGIPDAPNTVVINIAAPPNMPVLDISRTITTLTISNGILDLNGLTLTTTANANLNGGTIQNGTLNLNTFTTMVNMVFNGNITLLKTGVGNNDLAGNNTFNGNTTIHHNGTGRIRFGNTNPDTFNGPLTLINTSNNILELAYNSSGNQFNNSIEINATSGTGIRFGAGGAGTSTLADGNSLTIGASGFSSGELRFQNFTQLGASSQNLTLTGTALLSNFESIWNGNVSFIAPQLTTRGTIYNGTTYIEKTGATANNSTGGNVFNGTTELRNSGTAEFRMGNGAANAPDIFNGITTFSNTGTSLLRISHNTSGNELNNNVFLNSSNGQGVRFGETGGTITLANGFSFSIGGMGFSTGTLYFGNVTQVGATAQTITLTLNAILNTINSTWNGNISFISPRIFFSGNIFNSSSYFEKTGATNDDSNGGNTFQANVHIVNSGTQRIRLGSVVANPPDIFNAQAQFTNTGTSVIWIGDVSLNNQLNGNIIVESTSGGGILFGRGGGSSVLSSGNSISVGGLGFSVGELRFQNFIQLGATAQTITTTGTALLSNYESIWNGNVSFNAPQIITRGATYNGTVYIEKTGAGNNNSTGGNTFNSTTEIRNSGIGELNMGNGAANAPDIFNGVLTLTNTGTSLLRIAQNTLNNELNNHVILQASSGTGVRFGEGNGTITLASGFAFSVGGLGFSSGQLQFRNVTQLGGTAQNVTTTGNVLIQVLESIWNGNVSFVSPRLTTRGSTYFGTTFLRKTGGTDDDSNGGNTFHGLTTIENSGSNRLRMGSAVANPADVFNTQVTFRNTGSGVIWIADASLNNELNGNVILESNAGNGVLFGRGNGTITLASGNTLNVGGLGFSSGELRFQNFTQLGTTPQFVTITGTSNMNITSSTWNANVQFAAPRIVSGSTVYNGQCRIEKTGAGDDAFAGANNFIQDVEFVNSGTGYLRPENATTNTYSANVMFIKTNTGQIQPTHSCVTDYPGNISIQSNTQITFALGGTGRARFTGNSDQFISDLGGSPNPVFNRFTNNKTGGSVILNMPVEIGVDLNLLQGNVNSNATNLLIMNHGSNVSAVTDNAYVDGPVRKVGNAAFTFPIGKSGFYRPAGISAPGNPTTNHFTAEYFAADPDGAGYDDEALEAPLVKISDCEFWMIDRTNGSANVFVTLSYRKIGPDEFDCSAVESQPELRVARWDGALWRNHGNGGTTGIPYDGTITTSAAVTSFSPFTLATMDGVNPLPISLFSFTGKATEEGNLIEWTTLSERDNDYFTLFSSIDAVSWKSIGQIQGAGNSNTTLNYSFIDKNPNTGINYYFLQQTDYNGQSESFKPIAVSFSRNSEIEVYPNPTKNTIYINNIENNTHIELFSLEGKKVFETYYSKNTNPIQLPNLSSGSYIIRFSSETGVHQEGVIVE
jgi:hypothetical protein